MIGSSMLRSSKPSLSGASCNKTAVKTQRCVRVAVASVDPAVSNGHSSMATDSPTPLNFEEISEIVRMVNATDIVELELKSSKFTISMRKREAMPQPQIQVVHSSAPMQMQTSAPMQMQTGAPMQMQTAPAAAAPAPAAPVASAPPAKKEGVQTLSPMSGSFYQRPAPGEPSFVKDGARVKKGQTVGIIEAMKLMNEIEADCDGVFGGYLVENGAPVSSGQPLVTILP